jgi:predicted glycoside hydrolase/deacetylase ChbG (UPF0249 family)
MECFAANRISGASAMVFMENSERAAALATASGIDVGLHINFTESFTGPTVPLELRMNQERIRRFLRTSKYALLIYNPFLRKAFREVFTAQVEEFARLYGRKPLRFDGHHHTHLCSNMIFDRILPLGAQVRRSFSFSPGEKSFLNRYYRMRVDRRLAARHQIGDFFFNLSHHLPVPCLERVVELATTHEVELLTHPHVNVEYEALLSDDFANAISRVGGSVEALQSQNEKSFLILSLLTSGLSSVLLGAP